MLVLGALMIVSDRTVRSYHTEELYYYFPFSMQSCSEENCFAQSQKINNDGVTLSSNGMEEACDHLIFYNNNQ